MAQKAQHHDNLVETAMRLFRRQGYSASGLQQIIAEAGAPKGSLYHYFPGGKEELAAAAVELAGELVADMFEKAASHAKSAAQFRQAVIEIYAEWMEQGEFRSGCPIATAMLECAPQSPLVTHAGKEAFGKWQRIAAQAFRADPAFKDDPVAAADVFIASLEGALILSRVRQSTEPLRRLGSSEG